MSALRLYNTLTRNLETFTSRVPGEAKVYVCGPTVYDVAHAGNARAFVVFDVLVRHLRAHGLKVTYVRNITDVDDKILDRARENGEPPLALSARMTPIFQADMRQLGCSDPTFEPKVSESIPEIIGLVKTLVAGGHAYEVARPGGAHDVYFAVRLFEGYGKLSGRNIDELEAGARVERDATKRDPFDFALWKGCTDEGWGWDSPWGKGRPGWHIECSAMAEKFLGHGFDIHGGGMDLIFPHHENEIAQSEAAHPNQGPFAHCWLHNGFINVDKDKMSKSLGNFVKPRDVYVSNDPEALRYLYLTVQYRGPLSFDVQKLEGGRVTFPGVEQAERRIDYFYETLDRLETIARPGTLHPIKELAPFRETIEKTRERVAAALDDDLNTPVALAELGELTKAANELCDLAEKRKKDAKLVEAAGELAHRASEALRSSTDVLGLLTTPPGVYLERTRARRLACRAIDAAFVERKIAERTEARASKDFARADVVRDELLKLGIDLADAKGGTSWKIRP